MKVTRFESTRRPKSMSDSDVMHAENVSAFKRLPVREQRNVGRPPVCKSGKDLGAYFDRVKVWRRAYQRATAAPTPVRSDEDAILAWNPTILARTIDPANRDALTGENLAAWEAMPESLRSKLMRPRAWAQGVFEAECGRWRKRFNSLVWRYAPVVRAMRNQVLAHDTVCRYCLAAESSTVDHVVPVSRGGSNAFVNMVGACFECNSVKADRAPKEAGMVLHLPLRFFTL